jgi:hypothetical protein
MRFSWRLVAVAAALGVAAAARAQPALSVSFEGIDGAAVLSALAEECYEAGLTPEMPSESILACAGLIGERTTNGADRVVTTHRLRFTWLERAGGGRVDAEAWTEAQELGSVIEQPVAARDYLQRVERVLRGVVARFEAREAPPWAGRYESEQAWRLDAHLKAVSHCDANLQGMTADSVAAEMRGIGLRPLRSSARDRCEQLYTHLFEWALASGDAEPSAAEYARYRAALPPEQRVCEGLLALDASCAP